MNNFSVELFPVPHGVVVKAEEGETLVTSETLKNFINANTVPNDEIEDKTEETEQKKKKIILFLMLTNSNCGEPAPRD